MCPTMRAALPSCGGYCDPADGCCSPCRCRIWRTPWSAGLDASGAVEYLLEPAYHLDPFKGNAPVLVFRDYGRDIVNRLQQAGFEQVRIARPHFRLAWASMRYVVFARVPE